ncbi:mucin-2 isoform X2 [Acanthopagrus latus]|nr:mucin-2 isoform X2 [Acanthopagrus latus]
MTSQRWMLAAWFALSSVLGMGESVATTQTQKYTCRTFGSGVVKPFNDSMFYVRSNCPFTLTHFTHNRVECDITTRRGDSGLLVQVEIIINKVRTVLQNGSIQVERKSVSLPYDHTYQHIFHYGIYTRLRSSLLPLSVTWHNVPGGIDTLWVELEQELSTDMTGLCGKHNGTGNQEVVMESALADDTCQTRDPISVDSPECVMFFSHAFDCLQARLLQYVDLCKKNIYKHEMSKGITCSFFKEIAQQCGNTSRVWDVWRSVTKCDKPNCPGDLIYVEQGPAFVPSCTNPNPRFSNQDYVSTCVCPEGKVLNDQADGFRCVSVSSCPCVFAGESYSTGDTRSTKCQSCICDSGKWRCSENICPARCIIEGQHVTTFDGKEYVLPGKCTYVALQGFNWTIKIEFSEKAPSLKTVAFHLFQEKYTLSQGVVKIGEEEITELHKSDNVLVFWQSSMYVQFHTSFGMKIEVQMSPEIQLYITPPANHTGMISGLCGNSNNDTTDDFTTTSGIIENSAQPFAQSWSVGDCAVDIPDTCINKDNELFADEKCSVLNNPDGIFAVCHGHIPTDYYHRACILRTCNCGSSLQQCLCVALSSYAKACASLGVVVGDWRKATNCTVTCQKNQEFSYDTKACNHTCLSLSGPDPRCGMDDAPVEGCGCPDGTHLNQGNICTRKADCVCHYYGGTVPPGSAIVDGRKCYCENGQLQCFTDCGCLNEKVCVHCASFPVDTAQKTCDSLSKPMSDSSVCNSGCYCPEGQYEDHHGNCVTRDNCTCVYSGKVFSPGQHVKTKANCKTCTCGQGQWHCKDEPCPGTCQVYGNGHYQTFDSKWYRFDGHCQYTLVEDGCENKNGTFSVRVESVPCCDEALTCSRSIILDLQGKVTLTLSDMNVTRQNHEGWTLLEDPLYSIHTVGLYIIISVPSRGITLIWDKHTRITIELHEGWRNQVCGLCGNFDSNEMNDLKISGSAVASSPMAFGNSWKAATPPCSDVTTEIFPCERNSYCSAWAQRRCMIIRGDTFKACHFKVDPEPYYHACVQESCSCEFEGKFLGFCTAVAAYAEACSDQDVCVNWRTPDLCPVYCDYYNEQGQCSWHYEACGKMLTCSEGNYLPHKLEGCYPRCPMEAPYYDENTGECTELRNCTCYFNDTIIQPWAVVMIDSTKCRCENGKTKCTPPPPQPTTTPSTIPTSSTPITTTSTTTETTVLSTTSPPTTTTSSTTTETTLPSTTSPLTTTTTSTTTETTVPSTTSTTTYTNTSPTTETTLPSTTSPPMTANSSTTPETTLPSTTSPSMTTTTYYSTEITLPSTTSPPMTANSSTTPETTLPSTTSPLTTTTTSTTTETTVPSTTSTTTYTNTSPTTETTLPSTTSPPMTANSSTTPETTLPSTTSPSMTTTTYYSTEITLPSTTSPLMTTNTSTTPETTLPSTTSPPMTTNTSTTPETTLPSTTSPSMTTTTYYSTETTLPSTTSPSMTTNTSTTPETTLPSTTSPSMTTNTSTTPETTLPSTTSPSMTTNTSTTPETTLPSTTSPSMTTNTSTTPETTLPSTTSPSMTTNTSTITETTLPSTTSPSMTTNTSTTPETTLPSTTSPSMTTNTSTTPETTLPSTTSPSMTTNTSTTPETTLPSTTSPSMTTNTSTITETTLPSTTSPSMTTNTSTITETTTPSTTSPPTTTTTYYSMETTVPSTTSPSMTTAASTTTETTVPSTSYPTIETGPPLTTPVNTTGYIPCMCEDLRRNKAWSCDEKWTEDCFNKICKNGTIELTPVVCPEPIIPTCPRNLVTKVSDGCCETWKCDCRCELYGDPHYISFEGVTFDFLEDCTYILVEEPSPRHHLTIAVDNFYCVPGIPGSCVKGIMLKYQNNTARLSIMPHVLAVQATLNNEVIKPPYEENGLRFETTGYQVFIYLPEIRSYVSLSPTFTLVVSLAMEHFLNNTQGQCGACGVGSCVRKGGKIEDDSCCDKTAYDWLYDDPLKPACASAPRDVPCHPGTTTIPTRTFSPTTSCLPSPLCELLDHPVFSSCSPFVDLFVKKKNCEFDSCRNGACSSLEQTAEECKKIGICIDWRELTNGSCGVPCPAGLIYRQCHDKLDDVCYGGVRYPGASIESNIEGCFCPSGLLRAGNHSNVCVPDCPYCKGPYGEPRLPGEEWESGCYLCTCNNRTLMEECIPKPIKQPISCSPNAVLVNTSCCGDQECVEKTCTYNGKTYMVGDRWMDTTRPCLLFNCTNEGIQTETRVCPAENCQEADRIWDKDHCCYTCNQSCTPKVTSIYLTVDNCTTIMQIPVCEGRCVSQPSVVLHGDLQVEKKCRFCHEQSSERRLATLQCFDLTTRQYTYRHITSCECRACEIQK